MSADEKDGKSEIGRDCNGDSVVNKLLITF